jgi:hypothetical protein
MNKERAFAVGAISFLAIGGLLAAGGTDAIYVAVSIAMFLVGIAYAAWCEKI